jgi:hypothetical protein
MESREFFHTLRSSFFFVAVLAGVLLGFMLSGALVGAVSFRHPWTWILPVVGLAIFDGIICFFYPEHKSVFRGIIRLTHRKSHKELLQDRLE